ncbi:MAG TPA: DUF2510 domain-containing protein, partial [Thermoleophilaceae bacterium]
ATESSPTGAAQPASPMGAPAAGGASTPAAQPAEPAQSAQPAAAPEAGGPPAGWYPDPQGQARLRYWDGGAWTEQTSA